MNSSRRQPTQWPQWLLLVALVLSYPVSAWIPHSWSWENGIIENTQVVVLLGGMVLAGLAARRLRGTPASLLARCTMPVWAILAARELSWGAVFLAPNGFSEEGPLFSSHFLWYKPYVAPVLLVVLSATGVMAYRYRIDQFLKSLVTGKRFPWLAMGIAVIGAVLSTLADGHLGHYIHLPNAQGLEELSELVGYAAIVVAQRQILGAGADVSGVKGTQRQADSATLEG